MSALKWLKGAAFSTTMAQQDPIYTHAAEPSHHSWAVEELLTYIFLFSCRVTTSGSHSRVDNEQLFVSLIIQGLQHTVEFVLPKY